MSAFRDFGDWNCCSPYNSTSNERKMTFVGQLVPEICDFVCHISAFRLTPIRTIEIPHKLRKYGISVSALIAETRLIRKLKFWKSAVWSVGCYPWAEYDLELMILDSFLDSSPNQTYSLTENGGNSQINFIYFKFCRILLEKFILNLKKTKNKKRILKWPEIYLRAPFKD
jgi:hypothetical protein